MKKKINFQFENGFSFLELLIVIVIIGIMSTSLYPKFANSQKNGKLEEAKVEVATFLRLVRMIAMSSSQDVTASFSFDPTGATQSTYNAYYTTSGSPLGIVGTKGTLTKGVTITDISGSTTSPKTFQFFNFGTATAVSVHLTLTDPVLASTSANRRKFRTVTVVTSTGRAQAYDYGRNTPFPAN